jgi:hypothetical protein
MRTTMNIPWQALDHLQPITTKPTVRQFMKMPAWFHPFAVALLVTPAFANPLRTQTLASSNAVPEGLTAPEWSSIRQQYEQQRHAAYPVAGGYQARNPGQQWQTRFDGRGFTTKPEGAAWQWGLELQSYGFPGQERAVQDQPRVKTSGPRVTYDWDATVQEWFVNDRRGLEHGFTARERPKALECASPLALWLPGGEARLDISTEKRQRAGALQDAIAPSLNSQPSTLNFLLAVRGGLRPEVQADGRGVRFVDAQGAAALTYSELTVLDADGRKLPARFEPVEGSVGCPQPVASEDEAQQTPQRAEDCAPYHESALRLAIDERGARYPLTIDPIAQQAYLKASNTEAGDQFGWSVAVSGDTVVVGAVFEDSSATGVDGDQYDNSAEYSGAAYVFVRNGTNWSQQAYLKASNTDPFDCFGWSVAVSGDTVVVGGGDSSSATGVNGNQSDTNAPNSGAAYVFVRNGTTWTQQAYLKASNTDGGDEFGRSVAMSGDTVVVGSAREASSATGVNGDQSDNSAPESGAAYVFVRSGTTWTQQAYLKASNTEAGDVFGWSVSVSGNTVVVGAIYEDSSATGVNGNQSDNSATNSGAAYVFVRSGGNWSQQAYLKASNTGGASPGYWSPGDSFGSSVAVSGDTVVVGALSEGSSARGVNGNQSNNNALESGAAYVFVRTETNWSQQAYLKASNTGGVNLITSDSGDTFGGSVAVSGDTVVVGAPLEGSNATGVNGNQSNNNALISGAAYIFTGVGLGPTLALAPDGSGGYLLGFNGVPTVTYHMQRAPSVTGPWSDLVTNTAPASGRIEYHETSPPPGAAFYRTAQP